MRIWGVGETFGVCAFLGQSQTNKGGQNMTFARESFSNHLFDLIPISENIIYSSGKLSLL